METKELKIQAPEGYEIDREESTLDCIKFKPIKKIVTYRDVCDNILNEQGYYINSWGVIKFNTLGVDRVNGNNATNEYQLKRILALNQLLNIAEYYNRLHTMIDKQYVILYDEISQNYTINQVSPRYRFGIEVAFNRAEDAQAVIDNPNFREILDTIHK